MNAIAVIALVFCVTLAWCLTVELLQDRYGARGYVTAVVGLVAALMAVASACERWAG